MEIKRKLYKLNKMKLAYDSLVNNVHNIMYIEIILSVSYKLHIICPEKIEKYAICTLFIEGLFVAGNFCCRISMDIITQLFKYGLKVESPLFIA